MKLLFILIIIFALILSTVFWIVKKNYFKKQTQISSWLMQVKTITAENKTGQIIAKDKLEKPILLEYTITDVRSPNFSALMQETCDVFIQAFVPVELQFLKESKDKETHDQYIKQFEPIFQDGKMSTDWELFKQALKNLDWKTVEEKMPTVLTKLQLMDYSNFGIEDMYCFILAKDINSKKILGYSIFCITPTFPHGDIKLTAIGISPTEQNRGIGRLFIKVIYDVIPDLKRICLSVRPTNNRAITAYKNWGFVTDHNPIPESYMPIDKKQWTYLEYKKT